MATEPFLPVEHWTRDVLRRLAAEHGIDADPVFDAWPLRRSEVRAALERAVTRALHASDDDALRFARQAMRAFEAEFPVQDDPGPVVRAWIGTAWSEHAGELAGGTSRRSEAGAWSYPGPVSVVNNAGAHARLSADVTWRFTAVRASASTSGEVDEANVAVRAGPLDLWAGRRALGFGVARGGSIVLSPAHPIDAVGIRSAKPIALPVPFAVLGTMRATVAISRFARSGNVMRPWFAATSLRLSPSTRFSIGLHRAALFGANDEESVTATNIALMMLGLTSQLGKDSGFENQVASVDVWFQLDPGIPLVVYGELGADDVGFSFLATAATVVGIEAPTLPVVPALGVGLEHVRFPGSCCGHPPWYRHGDLGDGWTEEGRLLGHALAGHGSEWALYWDYATAVRLGGRLIRRARHQENLFTPDHGGSSYGGALHAVMHAGTIALFRLALQGERGNGWQAWSGDLGLQLRVGSQGARRHHQRTRT